MASKPAIWMFYMTHLSAPRRTDLKALGVESSAAIPDDFHLSLRQTCGVPGLIQVVPQAPVR